MLPFVADDVFQVGFVDLCLHSKLEIFDFSEPYNDAKRFFDKQEKVKAFLGWLGRLGDF